VPANYGEGKKGETKPRIASVGLTSEIKSFPSARLLAISGNPCTVLCFRPRAMLNERSGVPFGAKDAPRTINCVYELGRNDALA